MFRSHAIALSKLAQTNGECVNTKSPKDLIYDLEDKIC